MAIVSVTLGLLVFTAIAAPLAVLTWQAGGLWLSGADLAALEFTLIQAGLSALFSVGLAVPIARALARRRFWGRGALITLMGAPFLLPVIVAVLGLLAIFGRSGVLNQGLALLGLPEISVYGLHGVVLAHVFLNLPLAARMLLQGWQSIPAERFRLAESLDFAPKDSFWHLEWPMLRRVLPGALATVFAVCLTSFAVALTLGGGPKATTLELAIYQAVRFEFDLAHAAGVSLLQVLLGGASAFAAWSLAKDPGFGAGLDRQIFPQAPDGWRKLGDFTALILVALFLASPLLAVLWRGVLGLAELPPQVWQAALRSVGMAVASAVLTVSLALILAKAAARRKSRLYEMVAVLPLAASGLVLGVGLFLILQPYVSVAKLALPVTAGVNILMALPFAFRVILPEARLLRADYGRLAASLDLTGFARFRWLVLPRLARPIGFAAGLAAALSMGDLGVIALFSSENNVTLPLIVQQLMGSYRTTASWGAALVLVVLSFGLFWMFDAWGRRAYAG